MPPYVSWICILLAVIAVIFFIFLLKWKKWGQDYDDWIRRNCTCPDPDEEPPTRPPFP